MGLNEYLKIGSVMKKLRKEQGYTQAKLAEKIGIPRATYANYESNTREPDLETLKKIAESLGVTDTDILFESEFFNQYEKINITGNEEFMMRFGAEMGIKGWEEKQEQVNEATATDYLFKKYGFEYNPINENLIAVTDNEGSITELAFDEYINLNEILAKELKSYAIYLHHAAVNAIIKNRGGE